MKEVYVIILHNCVNEVGLRHSEPIESVELDHYPTNDEIEEGAKFYGAEYARVEKRYRLREAHE